MENKMKTIKHSLDFVTELDENDLTAKRLLSLPKNELDEILKDILVRMFDINNKINDVNLNNSWAKLKLLK